MKKRGRKSAFSIDERRMIVLEYDQGTMSRKAICQKYGIRSHSVLSYWRKQCFSLLREKAVSLLSETNDVAMEQSPREEIRALRATIASLENQLQESELRNTALNTLIDIAEEQGLKIRKNFGAKR